MSNPQIIYLAALVAAVLIRRPCFATWGVCGNALGILAVCGLMDLGAVDRSDATLFMMLVDLVSGVALATRSGLARAIAWGYALNVLFYSLNIILSLSPDTTFALVYLIGFIQIGMLAIGPRGDNGSFHRGGLPAFRLFAALSGGNPNIRSQGSDLGTSVSRVKK